MKNIKLKNALFLLYLTISINGYSQDKSIDQKQQMAQYIGSWLSTDNIFADQISLNPRIKVNVMPKLDENSLQVEVFENLSGKWKLILVELISYDNATKQIVALGQNQNAECFFGKGFFDTNNHWVMNDVNLIGEPSQIVSFDFISNTEVLLHSVAPDTLKNWEIKYIKNNPKDKNIGIQLVSVKDAMNENPAKTLQQLGRMGYSYIETYVYSDRKFYGMEPKVFKKLVENNDMKFSGSMTFKSLPSSNNWKETMEWWITCIQDHIDAGVDYLTTSNNDIKKIKSLKELNEYCKYYNAIGKLCKQKGVKFGFHNHADEFIKIEGETVYDYLLKNTDAELVSFQVDLYWMRMGGAEPIEYFNKYPGRFFSWHTKDDAEIGSSGKVDFEQLFSFAKQAGLKYNVVEVEKYNNEPLVSVEMAYRYLYYSDFVKLYK